MNSVNKHYARGVLSVAAHVASWAVKAISVHVCHPCKGKLIQEHIVVSGVLLSHVLEFRVPHEGEVCCQDVHIILSNGLVLLTPAFRHLIGMKPIGRTLNWEMRWENREEPGKQTRAAEKLTVLFYWTFLNSRIVSQIIDTSYKASIGIMFPVEELSANSMYSKSKMSLVMYHSIYRY